MIKHIKNDYKNVTEALGYVVGRKIPLGIGILYYIIVGAIMLPFMPFIWIYYKLYLLKVKRYLNKY